MTRNPCHDDSVVSKMTARFASGATTLRVSSLSADGSRSNSRQPPQASSHCGLRKTIRLRRRCQPRLGWKLKSTCESSSCPSRFSCVPPPFIVRVVDPPAGDAGKKRHKLTAPSVVSHQFPTLLPGGEEDPPAVRARGQWMNLQRSGVDLRGDPAECRRPGPALTECPKA